MPDIARYLSKHRETATRHGLTTAATQAAAEASVWGYSRVRERVHGSGQLIWEDDWDICCVVDACRWDLWEDIADKRWPAAESAWSVGSASPEWYGNTFDPENIPDCERIGVITANPFASKDSGRMPHLLGDATPLHKQYDLEHVEYVHEAAWGCEVESGYLDVVHPAEVTNRAWEVWQEEDLDRLVLHYMQPHIPFRSRPEWFGERENLANFAEADRDGETPYQQESTEVWKRLAAGDLEPDAVWAGYRDNLRWVREDIDRLRTAVGEETELLLTSDHGNAMGEWGLSSHPPRIHVSPLRRVPWVTVSGDGGEWVETSVESGAQQQELETKLHALGYK